MIQREKNQDVYYFSHIELCYVDSGFHYVAVAVGRKEGVLEAKRYYDVSQLFDHVRTDGEYWYSVYNREKLGELLDFRIGILFEIAKKETRDPTKRIRVRIRSSTDSL